MMIDVTLSSWEDVKKAVYDFEKRIVFDTKNLDRMLILDTLEDSEYDSSYIILNLLDNILGGYWLDVIVNYKPNTRVNIDVLANYHKNKGET